MIKIAMRDTTISQDYYRQRLAMSTNARIMFNVRSFALEEGDCRLINIKPDTNEVAVVDRLAIPLDGRDDRIKDARRILLSSEP